MDPKTEAQQYGNLINLLAVFTEAENRLAEMQTQADDALTEILDEKKPDFAKYQTTRDQAEAAIKALAQEHPEWCDGRTIKTPYGSVRFTRATSLAIANPDATTALIKAKFGDGAELYLRVEESPNLETLEVLPDSDLTKLGIARVTTDSIKVTKAKVDMGKAGKAKKAVAVEGKA